MKERVVVFELYGDFAHFRKIYTTTSPLTYAFPPPTALMGLVGAILGKGKQDYMSLFKENEHYFAVKIVSQLKKIVIGAKFIDTKDMEGKLIRIYSSERRSGRTYFPMELVKSPRYRIYFKHEDRDVLSRFENHIKNGKEYYTVHLGISEMLAGIKYTGTYDAELENSGEAKLVLSDSVVPVSAIEKIDVQKLNELDTVILKEEVVPFYLDKEKQLKKSGDVIYGPGGNSLIPVWAKGYCYKVNNETVFFM
jgi:CRISPR-associated protein Cas5h